MGLQRGRQGIEPMKIADEILKCFVGDDVFDPQRQNRHAMVDGPFDLAANFL